ncbi:MAG: hypothetical protein ISS31_03440 [Kiritimatiellae bacterium]|nr:hypothetical protein [Kiritimatiellia bacterium]
MPEPEQQRPAPPRKELRIKRPRANIITPQTAIPVEQASAGKGGGHFLRKLLWLGLIGWLLFLVFMLLDPLPFLFPDDDSAGGWWRVGTGAAPTTVPEDDATPGHPELAALKSKVAAAIVADDLDSAIALVRRQLESPELYPYPEELTELTDALKAVRDVNTTVADIIRGHIDEKVVIRVKNRPVTIIPRASAGDRVNAVVVPSRTNLPQRSATFKVTDLDPVERSRWIGEADTPRTCLMKLYLHLEADDRDGARAFAPSCGILSEPLAEQLGSAAQ